MKFFNYSYRQDGLLIIICRLSTILFYILVATSTTFAQHRDSTQSVIENDLELLLEEFDSDEADFTPNELLEFLVNLAANPLNINRADIDELLQVPGLNFRMAQNIVQYRSSNAPFETVDDLLNVTGIGDVTLKQIRPYLTVGTGSERSRDLYLNPKYWTGKGRFEGYNRLQKTLEEQLGFQRPDSLGGFIGNPVKYYHRYRYLSNHLSINITQEKDPGEPLRDPTDFDYTSWHVALENNGRLKSFIVGDYSISFGQGLLLWSGGAFGKGSEVIRTPIKNERGIRPLTSAQEMTGFRGVAATYGERFQLTGFYSRRKRTASEIDASYVRFPTESGLHRTLNERARRLNLNQSTYGGRMRYQSSIGYLGVSGFHNRFDRPVQKGSLPWELYNFEGQTITGYSADFRILIHSATLFGEGSWTDNNAFGFLGGAQIEIGEKTDASIAYRRYDPGLQTMFGSGFGEQSGNPRNEEGFYIGIQHRINSSISISSYIDQFHFPTPRFQQRQPSSGYDWLGRLDISPRSNLSFYALLRFKQREEDYRITDNSGREQLKLGESKRFSARFQIEYQLSPSVRLRTRFDRVRNRDAGLTAGYGSLFFQDVRFYLFDRLRFDTRYTYFDTDGFGSRVYQFENNLLYVLSNTMLFDRGHRMYVLLNYNAADWLDFWFKISTTIYENRDVISSGNLQINGNRKSDIGVQARVRF